MVAVSHIDVFIVLGVALVLLLVLRFFVKMAVRTVKWGLYIAVIAAAAIYVAVRVG